MKKTLVAAGVIVALGVVWTAGAWYTGKQLEGRLADMVSEANAQIKRNAPEANVELLAQDYRRGLFSSQFNLQIKPVDGSENPWLKPGQSVVLHEVVDHGPLPLAQLKSFNLMPSMASVHTELVNNDVTKALFEIAKGESPFTADTRIGYSGDTRSDISLRPLNSEKDGETVAFSGGEFRLTADKDGNAISLSGSAESGLVNAVNEYGQKVQLSFNNLKTDGSSELASFEERVGSQKLSLDKLAIAIENKEMAVLDGMNINAKSDVAADKKTINSQLDYTLNSLKVQGQDLGSGNLTLKVGQIDGQAWHQFSQQYNAQTRALMAQPDVMQNPELYQQKATEAFLSAVPLLLKGEPVITIAPLSWKNAKGETTFNLSLFLKDPASVTAAPQTLAEEVDRNVKSLDSKLTIPVDMATEFMTQVAKLEGYQQEDAAKLANQQVKGLAAMGQMFRITTLENNTILASLQYANGQVTLNGEKMPLEQFVGMFGLPSLQQQEQPDETPPLTPAVPQQ
ncbi:YdgA family protein [Kosakonia oryzendophytica]|uniref:YdgA family protein n=1 Tax=Kosakonia TaxID=1330547 RepID=UPI000777D102|nr:YdgA family protein [Kosakonia oryzendophytica]WBT56255.1 YdgA family protein [Kosakonia oryzendophytica]